MKHEATLGPGVPIDIQRLIENRMLLQANSGGGKSWAIRRLCEQIYGHCQIIIIDVDGEYHTLREKYDYILAGQKGGDCPADIKSAALLARRLLELNVSAIIDIYELGAQRARFVKLFLEAIMAAPKDLWHPVIFVIDEAHLFAPEKGKAESADAVIDLMTRGRKRGFCGVLATQRIAKLNKDAAAECNNKLIGRAALDIDMKRAAEELGFTGREEQQSLRKLAPGRFFAFGPAFASEVTEVQVGAVKTTHLRAGQRAAPPTPPRDRVKKVLAQLADLPAEAAEEAKTVGELQAQVRALKLEVRKVPTVPAGKTVTKEIKVAVLNPKEVARVEKLVTRLEKDNEKLGQSIAQADRTRDRLAQSQQAVVTEIHNLKTLAKMNIAKTVTVSGLPPELEAEARRMHAQARPKIGGAPIGAFKHPPMGAARLTVVTGDTNDPNYGPLGKGEVAILTALIQYPDGLFGKQISVITGYVQQSRDTYISKLVGRGLVARDQPGHVVAQQPAASEALPVIEPLPTGQSLQDYWLKKLSKGEAAILQTVLASYPNPIQGSEITERTGYVQQSRDTYVSKMVGKEIISRVKPGWVRASDALFE